MKKVPVLLCWWYDRKDLINPFLDFNPIFEFSVLFYRLREEESEDCDVSFKKLYWTDFPSPYTLLKNVNPKIIIFMGVENLLTFGLNIAAKECGIQTIYLAHGITYSLEDILRVDDPGTSTIKRYHTKNPVYHKNKSHSVLFYLRSIRRNRWRKYIFLSRFAIACLRSKNVHKRLQYCKSSVRWPDRYILYAPAYKRLFLERDATPEDRFSYVGPYSMDNIFRCIEKNSVENNYWLIIDQPLPGISFERKISLFGELASQARLFGCKLKIKLHPMDYGNNDDIYGGEFILMRDEVSLFDLISHAKFCIGFFSALLLPIISFKKTLVIDIDDYVLLSEWEKTGAVLYSTVDDILNGVFNWQFINKDLNKKEFIEQFVFKADGESFERLQNELMKM